MNGDRAAAQALCAGIVQDAAGLCGVNIVVCPPFTLLDCVRGAIAGSWVALGAQDMDTHDSGAFTGQISAAMLRDCGCRYVIAGHSERRTRCGETDELAACKAEKALATGLTPILCIGETREQRNSGAAADVVSRQLQAALDQIGIGDFAGVVIAYEPVWAIGTGLTATPDQAQQMHAVIRARLSALHQATAEQVRILYGGSMKPENAAALLAQPDIDGGLIGGASLKTEDFVGICLAAQAAA